jgi:hypothetical protein
MLSSDGDRCEDGEWSNELAKLSASDLPAPKKRRRRPRKKPQRARHLARSDQKRAR